MKVLSYTVLRTPVICSVTQKVSNVHHQGQLLENSLIHKYTHRKFSSIKTDCFALCFCIQSSFWGGSHVYVHRFSHTICHTPVLSAHYRHPYWARDIRSCICLAEAEVVSCTAASSSYSDGSGYLSHCSAECNSFKDQNDLKCQGLKKILGTQLHKGPSQWWITASSLLLLGSLLPIFTEKVRRDSVSCGVSLCDEF